MDIKRIDIDKIFQSKTFKKVVIGIVVAFLVLLILGIGMMIGFKKASFSFRWGENYHKNFGGPKQGFFGEMNQAMGGDFIEGHGVFGEVVKIENSTLIIKGGDNIEKIVLIKDDTSIMRGREKINIFDLETNNFVVVIGEPNDDGQIEAKILRLMPNPSSESPFPPKK